MTKRLLQEGDEKTTDLPIDGHKMVERMMFGVHTIEIQDKFDIQKSKVMVKDYPSWDSAFDAVMDKAGI